MTLTRRAFVALVGALPFAKGWLGDPPAARHYPLGSKLNPLVAAQWQIDRAWYAAPASCRWMSPERPELRGIGPSDDVVWYRARRPQRPA